MRTFLAKISLMTDKQLTGQSCALGTHDPGLHTVLIKRVIGA